MIKLLREHEVANAFKKATKKSLSSVVAVPFWGQGAVASLGLSNKMPIRILCNLDHPGCNPNVIAEIRALGIKVRTHPRLHAKIYATENFAIVGSSNVSTNGMTVEGSASKGWIEANVTCNDEQFVNEVLELFEDVWEDPETRQVRAADIKAAMEHRDLKPFSNSSVFRSKTLLAACQEKPDKFESVYVAAYHEDLGETAAMMLSNVKSGALAPKPRLDASNFKKAWGYQFDDIREGDWLIDLDCRRLDNVRVWGCSLATGLQLQPSGEKTKLTITLRRPVTIDGQRLPISTSEKASLVSVADKIAKLGYGLFPLADVIKMIDKAKLA